MTQEEILAEMNALQASSPELSQLNSTSATSFFEQLKRLFAFMAAKLFLLLDDHQKKVESIYTQNGYGTEAWYRKKVLEFQLGDTLELIDGELKYRNPNNSKIIKAVKLIPTQFNSMILVATQVSYDPVTKYKLKPNEIEALQAYMDEIKLFNTTIMVRSYESDRVFLRVGIKINPLMLASDGSLLTSSSTFPVRDFLANLINTYNGQTTPITKYFIQQQLIKMDEVLFADVTYMNSFTVVETDQSGVGVELIDSITGTFYYDTNSIITYV